MGFLRARRVIIGLGHLLRGRVEVSLLLRGPHVLMVVGQGLLPRTGISSIIATVFTSLEGSLTRMRSRASNISAGDHPPSLCCIILCRMYVTYVPVCDS